MNRFGTILADPPWEYTLWSPKGQRAEAHYNTQGTNWICALPVQEVAAPDTTLLLWITNPKLPEAFQVITAWGFTYKTCVTWVKMSRDAAPRIGCGYHLRGCTEQLLIATRGNPPVPPPDKRPPSVFFNPIGAHSAKPEFQYTLAEGYPGPYLELFHRPREGGLFPPRENWTFCGNEVSGLDMREELESLAKCGN